MARERGGATARTGMSLKTRLSLWFTLALALISALILAAALAGYDSVARQSARTELVSAVADEVSAIEGERGYADKLASGELADANFAKGDVQLMVYGENGERYAGLFLHDALDEVGLSRSGEPLAITLDGVDYYYYDSLVRIKHGKDYWVRGIVRAAPSVFNLLGKSGVLAALIPAAIIIAFFGGRLLAGRFLRPLREIDQAATEIRESGDLSRRVPVSGARDELSALANDMNDMLDTLERNFEAERSFASSASHELRTPVAVIMAQCEFARDNAADEEQLRESIAAVQKQGAKMSGIIEALLMLTRMDQGTERYAREQLDLSALARATCEDFARELDAEARLSTDIEEGIAIAANRELIDLVLGNLLQNARRYGGKNIAVRLAAERDTGMALLSVHDDGAGIAADKLDKVWDLFYRGDASRSTEGLGLGLALVKRIAAYHDGTARLESTEATGTTFTIELPMRKTSLSRTP